MQLLLMARDVQLLLAESTIIRRALFGNGDPDNVIADLRDLKRWRGLLARHFWVLYPMLIASLGGVLWMAFRLGQISNRLSVGP